MRRIAMDAFRTDPETVFALAEIGETIVIMRDGRDFWRVEPCEPTFDQIEADHAG